MARIYLDSAPVIYVVEQIAPFFVPLQARLATAGDVMVSSDLTRMECLIHPIRQGNRILRRGFETFFMVSISLLAPIDRAVFERAAQIRAQYPSFKTPDALHLAAAVESACDVFLTNDQQLRQFTAVTVEVV